ncbi:L,D-transpeptidase family protein [Inquilinus sp. CAU 1745]|uniref:L,D-transpeptidase family protein n=1 Tax=Inquilinus sp. CAU 1745 TaxID=3140369 RepID=UPI00325B3D1C
MIITVTAEPGARQGLLRWNSHEARCALGRSGVAAVKREGDGVTPVGLFPLRRALYRPDRGAPPETALPVAPIGPEDGWCDDPADPAYNRPVALPHPAGHERMWRDDRLYDIVVVLGHNDDPPVPGRGSAIFLHVAREDHGPTEGCVAMAPDDLRRLLADCRPGDAMEIRLPA